MKRGRKDQLTGGSGDVNPQIMTFTVEQPVADTTNVKPQQLPIPRLPTSPGRNLVIELLWIDYYWANASIVNNATTLGILATVTTNPLVATTQLEALQDPRLLDAWFNRLHNFGPLNASTGWGNIQAENYNDLTDQAGHGILVASDTLYFGLYSGATSQGNQMVFKVGYRFKDVSLVEYIGIVQSQQ